MTNSHHIHERNLADGLAGNLDKGAVAEARVVERGQPGYPVALVGGGGNAEPAWLWIRGASAFLSIPAAESVGAHSESPIGRCVAIVGARQSSAASLVAARSVAAGLASVGIVVVSGGAAGVDAAAHRGALEGGGRTIVVLGTGIDVVFPPQNAALFREVVDRGGAILSQFKRGQTPTKWSFPTRNEVIAGLADTTLIIEAGVGSGTLYTASACLRLGRRLVVLRGSSGCDQLATEGAEVAADADEMLGLALARPAAAPALGQAGLFSSPPRRPAEKLLAKREEPTHPLALRLYRALDRTPRDLSEVAARAGISASEAMAVAIDLELGGFAERAPGGRYRLN